MDSANTRFRPTRVALTALTVLLLGTSAHAADYFLVIGGGPSPTNNQVSLEKNVHFIQRILKAAGVPASHQIYLFADGTDPGRDLHEIDPALEMAVPHALLARLTGNTRYFDYKFRSSNVPLLRGPATRQNVEASLRELASRAQDGDRVFIYLTGHGGKGNPTSNGRFYLWHNASMTVREFAAELGRFKPGVTLVSVMVQCYSGSFANIIFDGGDPEGPVSDHRRVGFFATVETRGAAGCTPDIEEENYREYSSYFWAALFVRTRTGQAVDMPDYDGDGIVSLDEAHAYVLIEADTIDIPVKTSDAYLRRFDFSKSEGAVSIEQPYEEILALAGPIERTVLERIRQRFNLEGSDCIEQTRRRLKQLEAEKQRLQREASRQRQLARNHATAIQTELFEVWPELRNPWRPDVHELLQAQGDEIARLIEGHSAYASFEDARARAERFQDAALAKEREWARLQRFLRIAENVVLEANLRKFGDPEDVATYDRIRALEHEPFLPFPSQGAVSQSPGAGPSDQQAAAAGSGA